MSRSTENECFLPAAPFRSWLIEMRRREADRMGVDADDANTLVAPTVGLSAKRFADYLEHDWDLVPFTTVDRALARQGSWTITDIYEPEVLAQVDLSLTRPRKYRCRYCGIELLRKGTRCGFCIEERGLRR